jgi:hypothetical protein
MVTDHSACIAGFKADMKPADVIVSVAPPLVANQFTGSPVLCVHGTPFWIEPSGEQYMEWAAGWGKRDG